jgi:hypothetical protein
MSISGQWVNIRQIQINTVNHCSLLETALLQLDFPAFLRERTAVAAESREAIGESVAANVIALTDFFASGNLGRRIRIKNSCHIPSVYIQDVPATPNHSRRSTARSKCSRSYPLLRCRGEAWLRGFADGAGVACSCYRPCKGTRRRSSLRGTRTGGGKGKERQVVSISEDDRVDLFNAQRPPAVKQSKR